MRPVQNRLSQLIFDISKVRVILINLMEWTWPYFVPLILTRDLFMEIFPDRKGIYVSLHRWWALFAFICALAYLEPDGYCMLVLLTFSNIFKPPFPFLFLILLPLLQRWRYLPDRFRSTKTTCGFQLNVSVLISWLRSSVPAAWIWKYVFDGCMLRRENATKLVDIAQIATCYDGRNMSMKHILSLVHRDLLEWIRCRWNKYRRCSGQSLVWHCIAKEMTMSIDWMVWY